MIRRIRAGRYDVGIDLRGDLRQITFFLGLGGMPVRAELGPHGWNTFVDPHVAVRPDAARGGKESRRCLAARAPAASHDSMSRRLPFCPQGCARCCPTTRRLADMSPSRCADPSRIALGPRRTRRRLSTACVESWDSRASTLAAPPDAPAGDEVARLASSPIVNLAGRTSLTETLSVLRHAAVTVAVDSGPMHLAAAAGSPVVALFGPGDPRECRPWSDTAQIVAVGAPCGCLHPTVRLYGRAGSLHARDRAGDGAGCDTHHHCTRRSVALIAVPTGAAGASLGDDQNVLGEARSQLSGRLGSGTAGTSRRTTSAAAESAARDCCACGPRTRRRRATKARAP